MTTEQQLWSQGQLGIICSVASQNKSMGVIWLIYGLIAYGCYLYLRQRNFV